MYYRPQVAQLLPASPSSLYVPLPSLSMLSTLWPHQSPPTVPLNCKFVLVSTPLQLLFLLLGVLFAAISSWLIFFYLQALVHIFTPHKAFPALCSDLKEPVPMRLSPKLPGTHCHLTLFTGLQGTLAFRDDLCLFSFYWLFCWSLWHPEQFWSIVSTQ